MVAFSEVPGVLLFPSKSFCFSFLSEVLFSYITGISTIPMWSRKPIPEMLIDRSSERKTKEKLDFKVFRRLVCKHSLNFMCALYTCNWDDWNIVECFFTVYSLWDSLCWTPDWVALSQCLGFLCHVAMWQKVELFPVKLILLRMRVPAHTTIFL